MVTQHFGVLTVMSIYSAERLLLRYQVKAGIDILPDLAATLSAISDSVPVHPAGVWVSMRAKKIPFPWNREQRNINVESVRFGGKHRLLSACRRCSSVRPAATEGAAALFLVNTVIWASACGRRCEKSRVFVLCVNTSSAERWAKVTQVHANYGATGEPPT